MYKNTRHSRKVWTYKDSRASSAFYVSMDQCRAMVAKCQRTFVGLKLLQARDFDELSELVSTNAARGVGQRVRRAKETLVEMGFPSEVIFAAPRYLLVAPKFGGLLARLRDTETQKLPIELRDFHRHLKATSALHRTPAEEGAPRVMFHISRDGRRTAFTAVASLGARGPVGKAASINAVGMRASSEDTKAPPRESALETSLGRALKKAMAKGAMG